MPHGAWVKVDLILVKQRCTVCTDKKNSMSKCINNTALFDNKNKAGYTYTCFVKKGTHYRIFLHCQLQIYVQET